MINYHFFLKNFKKVEFDSLPPEQIFAAIADLEGVYQLSWGEEFIESDIVVPNLLELVGFVSDSLALSIQGTSRVLVDGEPFLYAHRKDEQYFEITKTQSSGNITENGEIKSLGYIHLNDFKNLILNIKFDVEESLGVNSLPGEIIFQNFDFSYLELR